MEKSIHLTDTLREELAIVAVLYMIIERKYDIDQDLSGANRALAEIMVKGDKRYWRTEQKIYLPTPQGELMWENWKARWWDFVVNYDIYSGVDLQEGTFAEVKDNLESKDENGHFIWEDLRVAVCMRKIALAEKNGQKTSLHPCSVVFLSLLSQGRLDQSKEWTFDIAFDSIFWNEIENIVNSSVWPQELGYEDVSFEEVIDDIIKQGLLEANNRSKGKSDDNEDPNFAPSQSFQSPQEVVEEYGDEITLQGTRPEYYYYEPHWTWRDSAMTVGAIGLCWALF
jgi:hypothetical protein